VSVLVGNRGNTARTFSSSSYGTYHFDSRVLPCRFFACVKEMVLALHFVGLTWTRMNLIMVHTKFVCCLLEATGLHKDKQLYGSNLEVRLCYNRVCATGLPNIISSECSSLAEQLEMCRMGLDVEQGAHIVRSRISSEIITERFSFFFLGWDFVSLSFSRVHLLFPGRAMTTVGQENWQPEQYLPAEPSILS
jgi:hypothetical protein